MDQTTILSIIGLVVLLFFMSKFVQQTESSSNDSMIRTLTRQTARWASASKQDMNPLVAVLHSNYGVGYLGALSDLFTPDEIEKADPNVGKMGFKRFKREIVAAQDHATRKAVDKCPDFAGIFDELAIIAAEA